MKCAVSKCKNTNHLKACKISFFSFPLQPDLLKQWILFCNRKEKFNEKTSHVCMEHFKLEDFENNLQYEMGFTKKRLLKHGAVPTVRKESYTNEDEERDTQIQKSENKKIVEMLLNEHSAEPIPRNDVNEWSTKTEIFIVRELNSESEALSNTDY